MDHKSFMEEWRNAEDHIVAHTSGSTGKPKPIRLLKTDMMKSACATCDFFNIGCDSTLLLPLSLDYIAGKMQAVRAAVSGAKLIVVQPSRDFNAAAKAVGAAQIQLVPIVPAQVQGYLESPLADRTVNIIAGGAPLDASQEDALRNWHGNAYATYGMTETSSHVALRRVGDGSFHALPGYKFSTDPRGCLVIENEEMSWKRLITNDVAELHDSTSFRLIGRWDHVIITGGIKVHPSEVESLIAPVLSMRPFYISWRPSVEWGQEVVLALMDNDPVDEPRLLSACASLLPRHHAPRAVVRDTEPEYTDSGKLKRKTFPVKKS